MREQFEYVMGGWPLSPEANRMAVLHLICFDLMKTQ